MLGALINPEGHIYETIQNTLEDLLEEYQCKHDDLFVMIKPLNPDGNFKMYVYVTESGVPKFKREITLKEIMS